MFVEMIVIYSLIELVFYNSEFDGTEVRHSGGLPSMRAIPRILGAVRSRPVDPSFPTPSFTSLSRLINQALSINQLL